MATNKLTEVSNLVGKAAMNASYNDADGKEVTIDPTGVLNTLKFGDLFKGIGGGGSGDGNTDNPSAGVDYYAGSLADGEITDRNLLAQVTSDAPNKSTKVTFVKDVGAKVNMVGDGITILGHMSKVPMTKGVLGSATVLALNYDLDNKVKTGYFTTTSPYLIYIKQSDIVVGKKLEIPINGIGEGLSGKNVKAAKLFLTFNADNSVLIEHETGYDNDGDSAGARGANYDFIVDIMSTFSTQAAVAQLPASVNLFTGSSNDVALAGVTDFYEDSMDGIEVTFDDYLYSNNDARRIKVSNLVDSKIIRIPKEYLIIGLRYNKFDFNINSAITGGKFLNAETYQSGRWQNYTDYTYYYQSFLNKIINIGKNSINESLKVSLNVPQTGATSWDWKIAKVTPYKN